MVIILLGRAHRILIHDDLFIIRYSLFNGQAELGEIISTFDSGLLLRDFLLSSRFTAGAILSELPPLLVC